MCINMLQGNVNLTDCQKRKLRKDRNQLRAITDKCVSISAKNKRIVQSGGFLLPLLSVV